MTVFLARAANNRVLYSIRTGHFHLDELVGLPGENVQE